MKFSFIKILNNVRNFFIYFIKPSKKFFYPKNVDFLVYDSTGYDVIKHYLKNYSVYILHTRGEEVNIISLMISFFNYKFWKGNSRTIYCDNIIKLIRPKAIITMMDNDLNFYKIGRRLDDIPKIFIQNGYRGGGSDGFMKIQKNEDYRVNYMFVFNKHIGKKYEEYINGKSYVIGSIKNNHSYCKNLKKKKLDKINENNILLISNYRIRLKRIKYKYKNIEVSWDKFYQHDELVAKWLAKWCFKNNKKLSIAGFISFDNTNEVEKEKSWFQNQIGNSNCKWEFLPRRSIYDTYNLFKKVKIVVGTNTTVTYESFSTRKRTAFLTGRSDLLNENERKFGWPATFDENGQFWSNKSSKDELYRVMDFLNNVSDNEWIKIYDQYCKDLMFLDSGNKILIDHLKNINMKRQNYYKQ